MILYLYNFSKESQNSVGNCRGPYTTSRSDFGSQHLFQAVGGFALCMWCGVKGARKGKDSIKGPPNKGAHAVYRRNRLSMQLYTTSKRSINSSSRFDPA